MNLAGYCGIAKEAAKLAGEYLFLRGDVKIDENLTRDLKLSSDKGSEKIIIDCLEKTGLPILSEERGFIGDESAPLYWVVDPLDGSVNYFRGIDELTCISIALVSGGTPILGVVYRYAANELFSGYENAAFLNDTPIKTSGVKLFKDAVFATGLPAGGSFDDDRLGAMVKTFRHAKKVRMLGAAAVMSVFVSNGRFDCYREDGIRLWDVAGAAAIIKAAGGCFLIDTETYGADYKCVFSAFANESLRDDFLRISI
ncbi:inositol phosphatase [Clostridia bacterium]|nr:inositol phosphatase [Clostridia bacterium]